MEAGAPGKRHPRERERVQAPPDRRAEQRGRIEPHYTDRAARKKRNGIPVYVSGGDLHAVGRSNDDVLLLAAREREKEQRHRRRKDTEKSLEIHASTSRNACKN